MTNEQMCSEHLFYLNPDYEVVIKVNGKIKKIQEIKETIILDEETQHMKKAVEIVV